MGQRSQLPLKETIQTPMAPPLHDCSSCPPRFGAMRPWFILQRDVAWFYPPQVTQILPRSCTAAFSNVVAFGQ